MYGRVKALGFSLMLAASALAGPADVEVILTPQTAGPYAQGEIVRVDVLLKRVANGSQLPVRMLQLDTSMTDPAMGLGLPTTHTLNTGTVGDDLKFWYFTRSSGGICSVDTAADCGQKYYIEDDLGGTRPNVLSIAYLGLAQNLLEELVVPGDSTLSRKVGVIDVTMPMANGPFKFDVMNPTEGNPDVGGAELHVNHDLPLTPFRAFDGTLIGGTMSFDVGPACQQLAQFDTAFLSASQYPCQSTLSRTQNNRLRFKFDIGLSNVPVPGEIQIYTISPTTGAATGPDISGSFNFRFEESVGGSGTFDSLVIEEPGQVFQNNTWYAVENVNWCDAGPFLVKYGTARGDADRLGGTGFNDLQATFNRIGQPLPPGVFADSDRFDVDSLGGIGFNDLQAIFNNIPSALPPLQAAAQGCTP